MEGKSPTLEKEKRQLSNISLLLLLISALYEVANVLFERCVSWYFFIILLAKLHKLQINILLLILFHNIYQVPDSSKIFGRGDF